LRRSSPCSRTGRWWPWSTASPAWASPRCSGSSPSEAAARVEEPLVREAFFPSSAQHYAVETARPDDRPGIEAIAARHQPPEALALVGAWWHAVPGAFRVARSPRGEVVAFTILCELAHVPQRLLARDPLCDPWRRHLRTHPAPRGQRVLLARLALAHGTGSAPSPCFATLLRDMERASPEAGPALRRVYSAASGDELLVLDGRRIALTRLECDVLRHLRDTRTRPSHTRR